MPTSAPSSPISHRTRDAPSVRPRARYSVCSAPIRSVTVRLNDRTVRIGASSISLTLVSYLPARALIPPALAVVAALLLVDALGRQLALRARALVAPRREPRLLAGELLPGRPGGRRGAGRRRPPRRRRSPARRGACSRGSGTARRAPRRRRTRCAGPRPAPTRRGSRRPGVSITSAPPASGTSSRWVVAWRPRSSPGRTGSVGRAWPVRWLSSVVLPTPEEPSRTAVRPGRSQAPSASSPVPSTTLTASTGTVPPSAARTSSAAPPGRGTGRPSRAGPAPRPPRRPRARGTARAGAG